MPKAIHRDSSQGNSELGMRKPLRHDFVVPPLLSGEASLRWLLRSNCNGIAGKIYITGKSVPLSLCGFFSAFQNRGFKRLSFISFLNSVRSCRYGTYFGSFEHQSKQSALSDKEIRKKQSLSEKKLFLLYA